VPNRLPRVDSRFSISYPRPRLVVSAWKKATFLFYGTLTSKGFANDIYRPPTRRLFLLFCRPELQRVLRLRCVFTLRPFSCGATIWRFSIVGLRPTLRFRVVPLCLFAQSLDVLKPPVQRCPFFLSSMLSFFFATWTRSWICFSCFTQSGLQGALC